MITDLRSDTFTKPSPAMLEAMFKAEVGDDVFGEDPTVNKLEAMAADMFGMQAALFCASGTMGNQIAIKCHTQPGDEVICERLSHVYIYEGGGIAFNSSCQVSPIDGINGKITASQVQEAINPDAVYKANTSLVSIENTTNRGGGNCYEFADIESIKDTCLQNNLKLHLDGARIWNALVAKSETPKMYGEIFDSISVCLSKGLGAPVGSVLLGTTEFINRARRIRKVLGGGMRQAGYLAAAGIYALENNIATLAQDHLHARQIAAALEKKSFVHKIMPVETNILIFEVSAPYSAVSFTNVLAKFNILAMAVSPVQVRMVTHLDITDKMVDDLVKVIEQL
ncbi:aminotransferase class I/II-fold pyridoxal phosphate-dependent enzyme [Ferruginibacter lapsinanis]|uniref:threonine aldolase family protein n=1 Tax=Ferruginibacter lapsinanis TaxID=563172 RepID=UPI001E374270|nr:GntG family PLP-dependent aldolase [Ferruginibacter lapsinanis]UEG49439.1 aminotransferase class I/II-fold pyridoxal phosphate-dependent enzyme [Ferruginibacter lapsinanis]